MAFLMRLFRRGPKTPLNKAMQGMGSSQTDAEQDATRKHMEAEMDAERERRTAKMDDKPPAANP
jgi:hypothetical protein